MTSIGADAPRSRPNPILQSEPTELEPAEPQSTYASDAPSAAIHAAGAATSPHVIPLAETEPLGEPEETLLSLRSRSDAAAERGVASVRDFLPETPLLTPMDQHNLLMLALLLRDVDDAVYFAARNWGLARMAELTEEELGRVRERLSQPEDDAEVSFDPKFAFDSLGATLDSQAELESYAQKLQGQLDRIRALQSNEAAFLAPWLGTAPHAALGLYRAIIDGSSERHSPSS